MQMYVWKGEVLACRAQTGHSMDGWLSSRMEPTAMGWIPLENGLILRFLYHGTKRTYGSSIFRDDLHVGRMFAYASCVHPWDRNSKTFADTHEFAGYGDRFKDEECVIISVALALRAGCRIWQTQAKAFLIDRLVPPEAIIAVEQRGRHHSVRILSRTPQEVSPQTCTQKIIGSTGLRAVST